MSITKFTSTIHLVVDLAQVFLKLGLHAANGHGFTLLEYSVTNAMNESARRTYQEMLGAPAWNNWPVDWLAIDCKVQGQDTTSADNNVDPELSGQHPLFMGHSI